MSSSERKGTRISAQSCAGFTTEPAAVQSRDLDKPAASEIAVPSSITGNILRFHTPIRLSELLARAACQEPASSPTFGRWLQLALLVLASRRGASRESDLAQLSRLRDIQESRRSLSSTADLLALAFEIDARNKGLREATAYAGGPTSSQAHLIYTPHSAIGPLFEDLAKCSAMPDPGVDGGAATSITMFFCTHLHPFIDGNGRWSRIVALSMGAKSSFPAALGALIYQQSILHGSANDVWEDVRRFGLRTYLDRSSRYVKHLCQDLLGAEMEAVAEALGQAIVARSRNPSHAKSVFARLLLGPVSVASLKKDLGLSERSALGLLNDLTSRNGSLVRVDAHSVSARQFIDELAKLSENSLQHL